MEIRRIWMGCSMTTYRHREGERERERDSIKRLNTADHQ